VDDDRAGVVLPGAGREFDSGRSRPRVKIETAPGRSFVVFEAEQAPGVPGPPAHLHGSYDEAWYVIEGQMEFVLDGKLHHAPAGSVAFAPRGTPHTFRNPGPGPARVLAITTADALGLIEQLGSLAAHGRPDPDAVQSVMAQHDSQFVQPP
jgi:mannose-6-phosphate isomerase-like protein (cupin superfamily)